MTGRSNRDDWRLGGRVVLPLLLVAAACAFVVFYSTFYPVEHWLLWRYTGYWVACAVWSAACVSTGYALVGRLRGLPLPFLETLCLSFACGVVAFYLLINLLGAVHGLHPAAFYLLPLAMIAVGGAPLFRYLRRYWRLVRARRASRTPVSPLVVGIWVFGVVVLCMIYFKTLSPENAQFDAQWKHLALAEQYAHLGYIPRFAEGWTVATNPHLASVLYTWAFLGPSDRLFDQVGLALHMELTCFLWTLATIPAAVRLLVPRARASASWVARLLFPGVLLYDSSLSGGADHIAALFALPIFILLLRSLPTLHPGRLALLGTAMAGAALPKLTAGMLLVPGAALIVASVFVWRSVGQRKLLWRGPAAATAAALGATSFFWLRNWIWHGDPLYPSLHSHLALHPWTDDAAALFEYGYKEFQFWRPTRDWSGIWETLLATVDFSFFPNDYKRYHGNVPVFGSLYTLLLLALPFLKRAKRIWLLVALTQLALFVWFWVHHQDRYLQTLMPWMAAATAAIMIRVWNIGWIPKAAIGILVATQVAIGADVYFIQSHAMIRSPIKRVNDLLSSGYERKYENRFDVFKGMTAIRDALPEDAHVMLHDNHIHLGLSRRTTSDWGAWQFGLSYGRMTSPGELWDRYRDLGITHVVWKDRVSKGWDSIAGDLVFFDFAENWTDKKTRARTHRVARMRDERPPDEPYGKVLYLGCGRGYGNGLYRLSQMTVPVFGPDNGQFPRPETPVDSKDFKPYLEQADFVVIDPRCTDKNTARTITTSGFVGSAARRQLDANRRTKLKTKLELFVRRR